MPTKKITDEIQIAKAQEIFNNACENELCYKPIDDYSDFKKLFIDDADDIEKVNLLFYENETEIGYANGNYIPSKNVAYITFIFINRDFRRKKYGTSLLKDLQEQLNQLANNTLTKFDVTFFNPINLTWIVPNTKTHDHPNAPGVDVSCDGYLFLKNNGYRDTVYQNSFYQSLKTFEFSRKIKNRLESLSDNDLEICFYDKNKHVGMEELFDNLGSDDWKNIIMSNINSENPEPVLIAVHGKKAVGFTGPLHVQPSGRGYFAGIGVHSDFRKYGLGKALFSSLCMELKNMGAGYMTLFTGETNPARNIYEQAGFKIVKTWADQVFTINP